MVNLAEAGCLPLPSWDLDFALPREGPDPTFVTDFAAAARILDAERVRAEENTLVH